MLTLISPPVDSNRCLQISLKCEFIIQDIIITNHTHTIIVEHTFGEFFLVINGPLIF